MGKHIWLLLCAFLQLMAIATSSPTAFVYWSMDNYSGDTLFPENTNESRFQGNLSGLASDLKDLFYPGINGKAIYLSNKEIYIAKNLKNYCLGDSELCDTGLSVVFWLNVEKWSGNNSQQSILRTTTAARSTPGIYFGRENSGEHESFWMRRPSGQIYEVVIPHWQPSNTWTQYAAVWNKTNDTVVIYVNGAKLNVPTKKTTAASASVTLADLVIGSPTGPTFLLDELRIYYQPLTQDDVMEVLKFSGTVTNTTDKPVASAKVTQSPTTTTKRAEVTTQEDSNPPILIFVGVIIPVAMITVCLVLICKCTPDEYCNLPKRTVAKHVHRVRISSAEPRVRVLRRSVSV